MEERRYPLQTIIAGRLTCRSIVLAIVLAITLIPAFHSAVFADENPPPVVEIPGAEMPDAKIPDAKTFDLQVRPFLSRHCQGCHEGEKPKGKFRVERLTSDFADEANRERWRTVVKRVRAGEMPPKEKPRPPDDEVRTLSDWAGSQADSAEEGGHGAQGRVLLRRLNRIEYENTVRDLLGIDADLKELLPIDSSANGFDNNSEAQHVSSFLMDRYLEAADTALSLAIASGPQPPTVKTRLSCKDERQVKINEERVNRQLDDGVVFFSSSPWQALSLWQFYPPDRGRYRFRISANGFQSSGKPVSFRVEAGPMLMGTTNHLVGYFDAAADKPAVIEFVDRLEARGTIRILPYGLAGSQVVHKVGADAYDGPGLAIQWIDVEGPLYDRWPPESHQRIFGDLPQAPAPGFNRPDRVEVVSTNPQDDAERIIRDFARKAFRRPVTNDDVKPFTALIQAPTRREGLLRAGRAGRSGRGAGVAKVSLPAGRTGEARRFRPGQPAVVLPVEHDAGRRAVAACGNETAWRAGHASPTGRADAH